LPRSLRSCHQSTSLCIRRLRVKRMASIKGTMLLLLLCNLFAFALCYTVRPLHTRSAARVSSRLFSTTKKEASALSYNQQALDDLQPFPRTWVPLASTYELDATRPHAVTFYNNSYVVYCDKGTWAVFDDACPHRLAPLSQGRVDKQTGRLECSYHGWSFDTSGQCVSIPQASEQIEQAALKNNRCRVQSYPVSVEKNILFFWPWSEDVIQTTVAEEWRTPEGILKGLPADSSTFTRDLPYGWETLLENIIDPSHVPFVSEQQRYTCCIV
jgi:phenylpropionate dioxygenase-like ring-hydroxylating dioxygenase large terminal subunit